MSIDEHDSKKNIIKCLLRCYQELDLIEEQILIVLDEETEGLWPIKDGWYDYVYPFWVLLKDDRLVEYRRKIRDLKRQTQGVKKRFYDCFKRNSRDDFHNVDAVWEGMLMKNDFDL